LPFDGTPDAEWIEQYDYESDSDLGHFSDDSEGHLENLSADSEYLKPGKYANNFQRLR
jgi:hypothetical protein